MTSKKQIIIVGAGVAGLSFAYECLKRGQKVLMVEAAPEVGGLAKSIYHNDCFIDVGVHVMYLKDPQVYAKVKEIVPQKYWVKVQRNGKLYLQGRYIDWPLTSKAFFQFPFFTGIQIVLDQFTKKRDDSHSVSYQDELLKLYGPTLYYSFFHPLTQKFLHTDPKIVHSDWAFASLRAATKIEDKSFAKTHTYQNTDIDNEAKKDFNIFKFVYSSLTAKKEEEPFYYFRDGFGMLVKEYEKKILKLGGVIKTKTTVDKLIIKNHVVTQCVIGKKAYDVDTLVWAANPFALCNALQLKTPGVTFLNSKYIYVYLKKRTKDYQVCYYADPDISFVRTSIFSNQSRTTIRNSRVQDVICLEYSFETFEEMLGNFEEIKPLAIRDMIKTGIIESESDIESMYELNVPRSYPILTTDYRERVELMRKQIDPFRNIVTFGRQATFSYNNSDIIIKETLNHKMFK